MKGMILAAGLGTRMGPISHYMAKPAIPFLGEPLIENRIRLLRDNGIKDIIINLHHLQETVENLLGDGSRLGVRISYSFEDPILGSGGGIGKIGYQVGDDTLIVLNSDVLFDIDLGKVIENHKSRGSAATLLLRSDSTGEYGKVLVDTDGYVRKIEGYPESVDFKGGQEFMFAGLHVIEPRWFDYTPQKEVYESFPEVYSPMIEAGEKINSHELVGPWIDIGSARRLLQATMEYLEASIIPEPAKIGENSIIEASVLNSKTFLGSDCILKGVVSLGEGLIGKGCIITHSILCPGAIIPDNTRMENRIFFENKSISLDELAN